MRTAAAAGEPRRPQVTGPQHGKHRSTPVRLSRGKGDRTAVDEMPRSNVIALPDQDLVLRQPDEDGRSERSKANLAKPAAVEGERGRWAERLHGASLQRRSVTARDDTILLRSRPPARTGHMTG